MRRLWAEGISGTARMTAMADTGERLAGNVVLRLELVVTHDGADPYETTLQMPVGRDDVRPYAPGSRYAVKIDPQDRHGLTFAG
jgi:hypothetical protein